MVEQQRQRVEQEMSKMIEQVDKEFLRKIQVIIIYFEVKNIRCNFTFFSG